MKKHYEYRFYDGDVLIDNIDIVKYKIMHLPLCFTRSFRNCFNNENYDSGPFIFKTNY